jgi:hypothetical protein
MKPARKRPAEDLEERCPGGTPGRHVVRDGAPTVAAGKKQPRRARVEGWDERFVIGLAIVLAVIVAVVTIYQTIGWARS